MGTPHNEADISSIAKTVIMPGDPLRSKFIADNFLDNAKLVNNVRGVQGYTGTWKGIPVTVMASGMGMPSIGIYSAELFEQYDVDNIIRVGSVGAIQDDTNLMDIIIAEGACTDSNYISNWGLNGTFAPIADYLLLSKCVEIAEDLGLNAHVGNILSSDNFYYTFGRMEKECSEWKRMGVLGIEMEAAALYANAAYYGKRALCLLTVSDQLVRNEKLSPEDRMTSFSSMIRLALDTAVKMEDYRKDHK